VAGVAADFAIAVLASWQERAGAERFDVMAAEVREVSDQLAAIKSERQA